MKTKLVFLAAVIFIFNFHSLFGQSTNPNSKLDPKWVSYYGDDPAGINEHYQGSDFIKIATMVSFEPILDLKDKKAGSGLALLRFVFLRLSERALNQFRIDGEIMCQTYKHDDYFELYNMYYKKVSKATWDQYAPYLIVLMVADGLISDR